MPKCQLLCLHFAYRICFTDISSKYISSTGILSIVWGCKYECECESIGCLMLVMVKTQVLSFKLTVHVILAALISRLNDGRQNVCRWNVFWQNDGIPCVPKPSKPVLSLLAAKALEHKVDCHFV